MADYNIGDLIRLPAEFHDLVTGALKDPTTITVKVRNEAGDVTTETYGVGVAVVKSAVGQYYYDFTPTLAGTWYVQWAGTGSVQKKEELALFVRGSNF
jgi:hypothetical protein